MITWFLAWGTLYLAALAPLLTKSKLGLSIFFFLAIWAGFDLLFDYFNVYYIIPCVVVGLGLDLCLLIVLEKLEIDCFFTPLAVIVGMVYSGLHVLFSIAGIYVFMELYPWVLGITALIMVIEGIFNGFNSDRRDFKHFHRTDYSLLWIPDNNQAREKT